MSTTTIRLPENLRARVKQAARRTGTTPHGFILDAIAEKTDQEDRRAEFHAIADRRHAALLASGRAIPWAEMRRYLERRVAGTKPARPKARKLAR